MKLIDKDALVAEIERRIKYDEMVMDHDSQITELLSRELNTLYELSSFIKSLEVKEVDLDTEQRRYLTKHFNVYDDGILQSKKSQLPLSTYDIINVAKHFFELGLNASNPLTWEDVKEICVQSVLVEIDLGGKVSDERHYTEVLKRFNKERKGK